MFMNSYEYHVVILEARDNGKLSEQLYKSVVQTLQINRIGHSRITLPSVLELPVAFRIAIEATKGTEIKDTNTWQRPDGYIFLGSFLKNEMACNSLIYTETLRSLQDLACYYTLPISYGMVVADCIDENSNYGELGHSAALSCINLIDLKQKFGLEPSSILAP
jgi:6,7-dimethyl-8-ribityllumazine synthase